MLMPDSFSARTCRLRFSSSIMNLHCRDSLRDTMSTIESMQLMHRSYCEVKHPPAKHSPAGRHTRHNVQTQRRYLQISIPGHSIFWKSIHFSKSIHHASRHNASISTELAMDNLVEVWHVSCKTDRAPSCHEDQQSSSYRPHHLSDYWKTGSPGTQHAPDSIVFDKR